MYWIFVLVQKDSNAKKKKLIAARDLKGCLPSLPLKTRKEKKKIKVFSRDNFVLP